MRKTQAQVAFLLPVAIVLFSCSTAKTLGEIAPNRSIASSVKEQLVIECDGSDLEIYSRYHYRYSVAKGEDENRCFFYRQRLGLAFFNVRINEIILSKFTCHDGALYMTRPQKDKIKVFPFFGKDKNDRAAQCARAVEELERFQKSETLDVG